LIYQKTKFDELIKLVIVNIFFFLIATLATATTTTPRHLPSPIPDYNSTTPPITSALYAQRRRFRPSTPNQLPYVTKI
jgi:hypothetical protein